MDPRAERTRASLQQALLSLAHERPLDEITIADVAERAGVNRSSFYQHYTDKDTLLADALEAVLDDAARTLRGGVPAGAFRGMPAELGEYLTHVASHTALYRQILGDHGSGAVSARLRRRITLIVAENIPPAEAQARGAVPLEVLSAGIAGSVLGVIGAWVGRDPLPPVDTAAGWLESVLRTPARLLERE